MNGTLIRVARTGAAAALIAGCTLSPRPDRTTFLVLAPGAAQIAVPAIARPDLRIGVGPVTLPSYLDRPQFVTRVDAAEITVNEFARWAGPLDRLIAQTVADNLDAYLAPGRALTHPWSRADTPRYAIRIALQRFEATSGDSARLVGRWEIVDSAGTVVSGPQGTDDREGAAAGPKGGTLALSVLLGRLAAEIAGALHRLP